MIPELITQIDSFTSTTVSQGVGSMVTYITPIMGTFVVLYAVYKSFQYYFSPPEIPIMDVIKFYISLVAIAVIALNADYYMSNIAPIITGTGDELVKVFGGKDLGTNLEELVENVGTLLIKIWNNASGVAQSLFAILSMVVILAFALPFIMTAVTLIVIAKIYLGIVAILGVVYICFLFFPVTRNMFFSWLAQALGFTLIFLILSIVMMMMLNFINDVVMKSLTEQYTKLFIQSLSCVVIFRVFNAVLDNLTGFVQSISSGGGMSIGSTSFGGSAVRGLTGMMGKGIANMAGKQLANASKGIGKSAMSTISKMLGKGSIRGG